jgi:hypothetical protein
MVNILKGGGDDFNPFSTFLLSDVLSSKGLQTAHSCLLEEKVIGSASLSNQPRD